MITTRLNGDIAYLGQAHLDGDEVRLRMRDVATERIPTEIEGVLSNAAINFNLRIWRGTTRSKKHGELIRR